MSKARDEYYKKYNNLGYGETVDSETVDNYLTELEQQNKELCEKLISEILKMPNLKSEYCQASIIIVRNALDNLGYETDKPKYKQQEERDE